MGPYEYQPSADQGIMALGLQVIGHLASDGRLRLSELEARTQFVRRLLAVAMPRYRFEEFLRAMARAGVLEAVGGREDDPLYRLSNAGAIHHVRFD